MRLRPVLHPLLVASAACALVLGTAAPGMAGGADRKSYKTSVASTGSLHAGFGGLELVDYLSGNYQDRIIGSAPKAAPIVVEHPGVGTKTCKSSRLRLDGHTLDWSNVPDGTKQVGTLQLDCTYPDGTKHRFWWGSIHKGGWSFDSTDCLWITRGASDSSTTYSVTTQTDQPDGTTTSCPAQHELLDSANMPKGPSTELKMPFTAEFTVAGSVPAP